MKSVLLIAGTPRQLAPLCELLGATYTLFTASSQDEGLEYLRLTSIDVVIAAWEERTGPMAELFAQAKSLQPQCVTLYVAPPLPPDLLKTESTPPLSDFVLRRPFNARTLHQTLEQAMEKQRLLGGLTALGGQSTRLPPSAPLSGGGDLSLTRIGQILRHFARAFSTNFDLQRSLYLFLEAISEFLRPSRVSIMVQHPTSRVFEIQAQRGLAPKVAAQIRLRADEGLPHWLLTEGRLLHRTEVESQLHSPVYLDMHREMQALKALVSIPVLASGTLVGILNLGERVTGVPYTDDELELLFSLASHMAIGIQDITFYHAVQAQKTFTEKILRYMQSGVISVGRDEKIRLCNHRAAAILGKSWSDVLHEDVRSLPSPLGDMLSATLNNGTTYQQHEVLLTAARVSLAVNTYQIFDEHGKVSGSAMVFDDLTVQKQLAAERQRAEQLDFLNKVVGRMAHEIKNPLVSIQTFVELLNEHYDDQEFRDYFRTIVSRDVRTVDGITEKLVSFASKIAYRFVYNDVNKVLHRLVASLAAENTAVPTSHLTHNDAESTGDPAASGIEIHVTEPLPPVKFDPDQLYKALMYIALFLQQGGNTGSNLLISSQRGQHGYPSDAAEWVCLILTGRGRKLSAAELQQLFDPFGTEHSTLVDVGPCVSQKIIEEHGGRLDVQQEQSGDTTFVITLPITPLPVERHGPWCRANGS